MQPALAHLSLANIADTRPKAAHRPLAALARPHADIKCMHGGVSKILTQPVRVHAWIVGIHPTRAVSKKIYCITSSILYYFANETRPLSSS